MSAVARVWLAGVLALVVSATAHAQESKSAALAKELSAALDAAKLDSIATKDPAKPDVFFGALYFPNTQLLVVSAQYSAPLAMNETIRQEGLPRGVSGSVAARRCRHRKCSSRISAPTGSSPNRKTTRRSIPTRPAGKRIAFDGDWKKQQLSEDDYMKAFAAADERYSQMLAALIAQAKKTS